MEFFFTKSEKKFDDAASFCHGKGGILYEPRDKNVMENVLNHTNNGGIMQFWLGIHDKSEEGTFVYASDNTPIILNNWNIGEPNIYGNEDDCVNVANGFWHNLACQGYQMSIICVRYSSGSNF